MNNIIDKINDLFDDFEKQEVYINYVKIIDQMKQDTEITNLIKEIKRYQKIAVNNKDNIIEQQLKEMYQKLESYPIYQSYIIVKDELQEELFMISNQFDKYFNDKLFIDFD